MLLMLMLNSSSRSNFFYIESIKKVFTKYKNCSTIIIKKGEKDGKNNYNQGDF